MQSLTANTADFNQTPFNEPAWYNPFIPIMLRDTDDFNGVKVRTMFQNVYLEAADNELMLRNNPELSQLVLARICVNKQHQGTGTMILLVLEQLARDLGYTQVVIESILTPTMRRLAVNKGYHASRLQPPSYIKRLTDDNN